FRPRSGAGPARPRTPVSEVAFMFEPVSLIELEMRCLGAMTREQLLAALRPLVDCLPVDLRQRVAEHETERLRLLLCAARLLHALRKLQKAQGVGEKAADGGGGS